MMSERNNMFEPCVLLYATAVDGGGNIRADKVKLKKHQSLKCVLDENAISLVWRLAATTGRERDGFFVEWKKGNLAKAENWLVEVEKARQSMKTETPALYEMLSRRNVVDVEFGKSEVIEIKSNTVKEATAARDELRSNVKLRQSLCVVGYWQRLWKWDAKVNATVDALNVISRPLTSPFDVNGRELCFLAYDVGGKEKILHNQATAIHRSIVSLLSRIDPAANEEAVYVLVTPFELNIPKFSESERDHLKNKLVVAGFEVKDDWVETGLNAVQKMVFITRSTLLINWSKEMFLESSKRLQMMVIPLQLDVKPKHFLSPQISNNGVLNLSLISLGFRPEDLLSKFAEEYKKERVTRLHIRMSHYDQGAAVGNFARQFVNLRVLDITGSEVSTGTNFTTLFYALLNMDGFLVMINTRPFLPIDPDLCLLSTFHRDNFLRRFIWLSEYVAERGKLWEIVFENVENKAELIQVVKEAHKAYYNYIAKQKDK